MNNSMMMHEIMIKSNQPDCNKRFRRLIIILIMILTSSTIHAQTFNIVFNHAKADGRTINTKAIQKTIDACAKAGGGTVLIPSGEFITGTIYLKSNVTLFLSPGAVLKGSPSPADYPEINSRYLLDLSGDEASNPALRQDQSRLALIFAENADNVSIAGTGLIDGNGANTKFNRRNDNTRRPILLFFINCRNVLVRDIRTLNSVFWNQYYLHCNGVRVTGIKVSNLASFNNDGIDIESSNVLVDNCSFDTDDDAVCLKSNYYKPIENITISNCLIRTNCSGIKTGTASLGGFKNITVTNCVIQPASRDSLRQWYKHIKGVENVNTGVSCITLTVVDGGVLDGMLISNVIIRDMHTPIFIRLANRGRKEKTTDPERPVGVMRNIQISHVNASGASHMPSSVSGLPGSYVENVSLSDIEIEIPGGGDKSEAAMQVPEAEKDYPENRMYGWTLPSFGFWARHVKNLSITDFRLTIKKEDSRPAIIMDDAKDCSIEDVKAGNGKKLQIIWNGKNAG